MSYADEQCRTLGCEAAAGFHETIRCEAHYWEILRGGADSRRPGRPAGEPQRDVQADAKAITLAVLGSDAGSGTRAELLPAAMSPGDFSTAARVAVENGWLAQGEDRRFTPGDTLPPGKIPAEIRATMLVRWLREQPGWVPADDAARAVGFANKTGSYGRIAKIARGRGEMEGSQNGVRAVTPGTRPTAAEFDALRAA